MITSWDNKAPLKTNNNIENQAVHPKQRSIQPEYMKAKAEWVKEYMNTDKTIRQVAKEVGVSKSVLHLEIQKELKDNKDFYDTTLKDNRYNISYWSKLLKGKIGTIKIETLDDMVKIQDMALKWQKLVNMIEWASISELGNLPANINIQIVNK